MGKYSKSKVKIGSENVKASIIDVGLKDEEPSICIIQAMSQSKLTHNLRTSKHMCFYKRPPSTLWVVCTI